VDMLERECVCALWFCRPFSAAHRKATRPHPPTLAGTVCDFRLSYGRVLSRKAKIIAINRDRSAPRTYTNTRTHNYTLYLHMCACVSVFANSSHLPSRASTNMLRNSDMFWSPTLAAVSDVALFIRDLAEQLKDYQVRLK
jgi:hypothetical protein